MKRYLVFFSGQVASLLGSELVQFALIWWLTANSGTATALATAALAGLLPTVLLGPFAGAIVDRRDRRTVMMVADAAIAIETLSLALLFASGTARSGHIYGALFVRSLGGAFHLPAMQASVAALVSERHLARAAGANLALHFLAAPAFALVPAVTGRFGGGAARLAWMQSASGLGLVLGGLTLGLWGGFSRRIVTVLAGIAAIGVCLFAFGALSGTAFAAAVAAILGAGLFALSRSGIDAMSPLGLVAAGPLADRFGLDSWYLATGIAMAVMAGAAFFVPKLMNLEKRSDK